MKKHTERHLDEQTTLAKSDLFTEIMENEFALLKEDKVVDANETVYVAVKDEVTKNLKTSNIDEQTEHLIEKCIRYWKCKICDLTETLKFDIKKHAEKHLHEGGLDFDEEIDKIVEKSSGLWKCKACDKTA